MENDPLVLFFAESPGLTPEEDEKLMKTVIDQAIKEHRAPWWEIPPRGEKPLYVLSKHRHSNIVSFLKPYLEHPDEFARLWGTACAQAWGGQVKLNEFLIRLAHDTTQHVEIRSWAIQAVTHTKNADDIRQLYDLFDDHDDRVRGYVLHAYRITETPNPQEHLQKLRGGSRDTSLTCMLQIEATEFGLSLDIEQLAEAFQVVEEYFDDLKDLRNDVLKGLFQRAIELSFNDISPNLIIKLWSIYDIGKVHYEKQLDQLLQQQKELFRKLWHHILQVLKEDKITIDPFEMANHISSSCDDSIFGLLPTKPTEITQRQQWFINTVLRSYFGQDSSSQRFAFFQERAHHFTNEWNPPGQEQKQPQRNQLDENQKIAEALNTAGNNPVVQTTQVLNTIARFEQGIHAQNVTEENVESTLARLPAFLKVQVLKAFEDCVEELHYFRKYNNGLKITPLEYAVPFWVLHRRGMVFSCEKTAEFVSCYGFINFGPKHDRDYASLLEELHERDPDIWTRNVLHILEDGMCDFPQLIHYLINRKYNFYESRCRERLLRVEYGRLEFNSLVEYWKAFHPTDYVEVLRSTYLLVRDKLNTEKKNFDYWDQFRPLFILMAQDDDWAWCEFNARLQHSDVPTASHLDEISITSLPLNPKRLHILADWYGLIRRQLGDDYWKVGSLASFVMNTIIAIGGEAAIRELRRLQDECAYPNAQWLSHDILKIEEQILNEASTAPKVGTLLDFVNGPTFGLIRNERDLFEVVCEAIELLREAMEQQSKSVDGFWNGKNPKQEPACQNILWPLLELKLRNLGLAEVEIEEYSIGANRCDFWVKLPRRHESSFQTAVELKTARKNYGPSKLLDPIEDKLWEEYLRPTGCKHGVYIVLWFRDDKRYHWPKYWNTCEEFEKSVQERCEEVANKHQIVLASYVIDLTTPYRKH